MNRLKHALYQKGVCAYLEGNSLGFSRVRQSAELSLAERRLLDIRACFRESHFKEALLLLEVLQTPDSIFLQAEKLLLCATAHNQQGLFEKAIVHNQNAFELYSKIEDTRGQFLTSYNLSVDYGRLGLLDLSRHWIEKSNSFAKNTDEKVLIERAHACQAGKENRLDAAKTHIHNALNLRENLNEIDQNTLDTVAADVLFRCGDLTGTLQCLERIHRKRSNRENSRVEFDRLIVTALIEKKKIGMPSQSISSSPEHYLKWNLIQAIQHGENTKAHTLWIALQKSAPHIYGSPFSFKNKNDEQSIFGTFLTKQIQKQLKTLPQQILVRVKDKSRLSKLLETLRISQTPLRKEELIEKVWDTSYSPQFDSRLYKLIQRLRDENGIKVISENRAYRLLQ